MPESYMKTVPFAHQQEALDRSKDERNFALFMEMGTGKSKVILDNAAYLYEKGKISGLLIIAPKGSYRNWVFNEIPTHLACDHVAAYYTSAPLKHERDSINEVYNREERRLKILVMNVEAFSKPKGVKFADMFLVRNNVIGTMMVVDESTTIKNTKAKRTKSILNLGRFADYKRVLSGEPVTRSPEDLYAQVSFMGAKQLLGFSSFFAFRARYCVMETRFLRRGSGTTQFKEVVGYKNLEELKIKLQDFSCRVRKIECLDLPPKLYTQRHFELDTEAKRAYKDLKENMWTALNGSELVTTPMVITMLMKLQQICAGFLSTDDGNIVDISSNRLEVLKEVLEEVEGKAIIWCIFTHNIRQVTEMLGPQAAAYYGDTSPAERDRIVEEFQILNSDLKYFIGQPRTGGFGLTLTAAQNVIYFNNSYDLEIRLQSEDRAHRIGQENQVTYVDIMVPKTIDEVIFKCLRDKKNLSDSIMNQGWRSIFEGL